MSEDASHSRRVPAFLLFISFYEREIIFWVFKSGSFKRKIDVVEMIVFLVVYEFLLSSNKRIRDECRLFLIFICDGAYENDSIFCGSVFLL